MLTKNEFTVRCVTILAEYMTVMNEGKPHKKKDEFMVEFMVDGKRLLAVIENLTTLMAEMEPQMSWPSEAPLGLPYN